MVLAEIGSSAKFDGDCIVLETEHRDQPIVSLLPGGKYDADLAYRWCAPLTWPTCKALRGLFGDRLQVGDKLAAWSVEEYRDRIYPALTSRLAITLDTDPPVDDELARIIRSWRRAEGYSLYPYQETGVHFLATAKRALLTDEPGTGKTAQTIRTLMLLTQLGHNPFPALVVAPNTLKLTWKAEFEKWWPGLEVGIVQGGGAPARQLIEDTPYVVIANWDILRSHSRLAPYGSIRLKRCWKCDPTMSEDDPTAKPSQCERCKKALNLRAWKTVIADEVHLAKSPHSKRTRALWSTVTKETEFVFGLTGTPIVNNPMDLWPALRMLDAASFASRSAFTDRYCLTSQNFYGGGVNVLGVKPETRAEFFEVIDPMMRRMPKAAVLPFLPEKVYTERVVEMTPKQAKAYAAMEKDLIARLDDGILVAMNPLVQMTRLSQFASAYAVLDEAGEVKLDAPSCKVDALMEVLEELDGDPCVVFAQSRQLIELAGRKLESAGVSHTYITGGQSPQERQTAIEEFQAGRHKAILVTIAAGGVGLTLTRAHTAVFLQRSWSNIDNLQAEDRIHRIGSEVHDSVNIIDIIAANTVEYRQRLALQDKQDMLEEVVRDREFLAWLLKAKEA